MAGRDGRRIVVATLFTAVALPSIWLLDRNEPSAGPNVAAAGVPGPSPAPVVPTLPDTPDVPVFLENSTPAQAPVVVAPATQAPRNPNEQTGTASFRRFDPSEAGTCTAVGVPLNTMVSVTNLNNGLQLACRNTTSPTLQPNILVTIDTDLFATIADLTDAPVPVTIDW